MKWIRGLSTHQRAALVMTALFLAVTAFYIGWRITPGEYWDGRFLRRVDARHFEHEDGYRVTWEGTDGGVARFTYQMPDDDYEYGFDALLYGDPATNDVPDDAPREAVMTLTPIQSEHGGTHVSVIYGQDYLSWEGIAEPGGELTGIDGFPILIDDMWFMDREEGLMMREPPPTMLYRIAEGRIGTRGSWWSVFAAVPLFALSVVSYLYPVQVRLFGSRWAYESEPKFTDEAISMMRAGAIVAMVLSTALYVLPV